MSHLCVKCMRISTKSRSKDELLVSKDRNAIVRLTAMLCGVLTAGADPEAQSKMQNPSP